MAHQTPFRSSLLVLLTFLLSSMVFQTRAIARELTPQERRGKEIYLRGVGSAGQAITALLGGIEVPASVIPCGNCHGHDGRGKPEGGVIPSNITWQALIKPYGTTHPSGRQHPPYTEQRLKRAITMGFDPAGNRLNTAMPQYRLLSEDLADLVAYLKQVGKDLDPGLTDTHIRIGTILAPGGQLPAMSRAVKAILTAYFDEINRQGGIYNRRIDLCFAEFPDSEEKRVASSREFIEREQVFALTSTFMAGAEAGIASLVSDKAIPLIGAFTLYPQLGFPLNRYVFYLYPGLNNQGRALATFAAQQSATQNPQAAILYPDGKMLQELAGTIKKQCRESGWILVDKIGFVPEQFRAANMARELSGKGTEVVFLLGLDEGGKRLLKEAETLDWKPIVLVPGSLAGREIFQLPASFQDRIFLSFPTLPSDRTSEGAVEYRRLASLVELPAEHLAAQLAAVSSAKVLVEGLKQAGRDVSREKLVEALEGLYEFRTDFTPPITYGPNRRVGALGAYIVSLNLERKSFVPVSGWMKLSSVSN